MSGAKGNLLTARYIPICKADGLQQLTNERNNNGYRYDFLITTLSHPRCCADPKELTRRARELFSGPGEQLPRNVIDQILPPIGISSALVPFQEWSKVIGKPSPWINPDSEDPYLRRISEHALAEELEFFLHLELPAVVITLRNFDNSGLARILNKHLTGVSPIYAPAQFWVEVPAGPTQSEKSITSATLEDAWHRYYNFRTSCNNHPSISFFLDAATEHGKSQLEFARWKGEAIAAVKIDKSIFSADSDGKIFLNKDRRDMIGGIFEKNSKCIVELSSFDTSNDSETVQGCYSYLIELRKEQAEIVSNIVGYDGKKLPCGIPLQPLGINVPSRYYGMLERDPVKYKLYAQALQRAIAVKTAAKPNVTLIIMVLGCGRGPLVTCSYEVLKQLNVRFKLYAVEKNPFALPVLHTKRTTEWNNEVDVICSDMRNFKPERKADIIVSELLGGFGCDELSPECLDGASHLMAPDCVSLPTSYCNFLQPIHSAELYCNSRAVLAQINKSEDACEKAYVFETQNLFRIADCKGVFEFKHPNWSMSSNERFKHLEFTALESCELAGFAGYFDAVLFGDVTMSTVQNRATPGLCSWIYFFFPIPNPVYVKKEDTIGINIWRCVDKRHVWYEWQLTSPIMTRILNPGGRAQKFDLF